MFCLESTEVYAKEVRCFHFPEWAVFTQSRLKTDTALSDTEETGPTISAMGTKSKRDVLIYAVCFSKIKEVCSVSPLKYTHYTLLFHFIRPPLKKNIHFFTFFLFFCEKVLSLRWIYRLSVHNKAKNSMSQHTPNPSGIHFEKGGKGG